MAKHLLPSVEKLSKLIECNFDEGTILWLPRTPDDFNRPNANRLAAAWNTRWAGQPAFDGHHGEGYRFGSFGARRIYAHRLIWAIKHGGWPAGEIDHINRIRHDNRLCNLREVCASENQRNRTHRVSATTGELGVQKRGELFRSTITVDGNCLHLGYYETIRDAVVARQMAEKLIDGRFARHLLG